MNDLNQGQVGVEANVTVVVRSLSPQDVTQATHLTLAADPFRTVRRDPQVGGLRKCQTDYSNTYLTIINVTPGKHVTI